MTTLEICGIGTAVPRHSIAQDDAAELARLFQCDPKTGGAVTRLYRRAGVQTRHSVLLAASTNGSSASQSFYRPARTSDDRGPSLAERMRVYEATASNIGAVAARKAIAKVGISPDDISHLVSVSCTGFAAPGFDIELCQQLRVRNSIARTHVGFMGCHALLNALRVAHAFTSSDEKAVVLVCAVELCSLHQQYGGGANRIVSNSLFSDGAAAMICRQAIPATPSGTRQVLGNGALLIPGTRDRMTWRLGDHGFEMTLSSRVPDSIREQLRAWLVEWIAEYGYTLDDIQQWAVHPGGPRILDAVEEALGLAPAALAASREVLRRYGNMSSPTVAFVLERLGTMGACGPCIMLGFGPGLTIEAALLL